MNPADLSYLNESPGRDHTDHELLVLQNKDLTEKLEALNQEVHNLRSRSQVAERIQADYQSDIEIQQQEIAELNALHTVAISKLKEEHSKIIEELESKIYSLESQLTETGMKHAAEKDEFIKMRKELNESPVASLQAELQAVLEEHAANRVACVQHQELNKILLKENSDLLEELNNIREHSEINGEKMKILKTDNAELSEKYEDLRDSYAVLQTELACLKSGPSEDASRGNSLFAEVEDKRQAMLQTCSTLSKKYNAMKKDYSSKCAEISRLKMENLQLRRQWEEEDKDRENRDIWINDNYEIRIKELGRLVENLKQEERPVYLNGDSKILKYAEFVVDKAKKEMAELRSEMEQRSVQRLNEAKALAMARTELLTLKSKVMSIHAENLVLRDRLEGANITDIPSPGKTLKRLRVLLENADDDENPFKPRTLSLRQECTRCERVSPSLENLPLKPVKEVSSTSTDVSERFRSEPDNEYESNYQSDYQSESMSEAPASRAFELNEEAEEVLTKDTTSPKLISSLLNIPKPSRCFKNDLEIKTCEIKYASVKIEDENFKSNNGETSSIDSSMIKVEIDSIKTEIPDEKPAFISPSLIKPINFRKTDKENITSIESENTGITGLRSSLEFECPDDTCDPKESSIRLEDETQELQKMMAPRRSILAKVSRPSLVPVDQNSVSRKVRFAESDVPVVSKDEGDQPDEAVHKQSPKKKLSRMPPQIPHKIRFFVSKETEL